MYGEDRKRKDLSISHPTNLLNKSRGQMLMDLHFLVANGDLQAQIAVRSTVHFIRGTLNRILFSVEFEIRLSPNSKSKSAYWQIDAAMEEDMRKRSLDNNMDSLARVHMRKICRLSRGMSASEKLRLFEEVCDSEKEL